MEKLWDIFSRDVSKEGLFYLTGITTIQVFWSVAIRFEVHTYNSLFCCLLLKPVFW